MNSNLLFLIVIGLAACAPKTEKGLFKYDAIVQYDGFKEESSHYPMALTAKDEHKEYFYFVNRIAEESRTDIIAIEKAHLPGLVLKIGDSVKLEGRGAKVSAALGTSLTILDKDVRYRKVN